jgi:peptide-methionine (S)-S-oxide reductase
MNAEQSAVAKAYLAQLGKSGIWNRPIATKIEAYKAFYAAEGYHQDFMLNNPKHGYIRRWDAPKVAALKAKFPALYRAAFLKDAG